MICYLRAGQPQVEDVLVDGAAPESLVIDIDDIGEPNALDEVAAAVAGLPEVSVVVLLHEPRGRSSQVPSTFEESVEEWAPRGGTWLPEGRAGDAAACLSLSGAGSLLPRLRRISADIGWQDSEPPPTAISRMPRDKRGTSDPDGSATTREVTQALAEVAQLQVQVVRDVGAAVVAELRRADRDVAVVASRQASQAAACFAEDHFAGAEPVRDPLELLTKAVRSAPRFGLCMEFGVYEGRTIQHIAQLRSGPVFGFDSFEGLPEDWRPGFRRGAFATNAYPTGENIHLVKGWFSETLPGFMEENERPVAFAHIDCDLYSSTVTVLQYIGKRLQPGSILVFDEYYNYPRWEQHEYKAWGEYAAANGISYEYCSYVPDGEQVALRVTDIGAS